MDYFRYTHVGASHVLKAAGLAVRSVHLVGGSELTSAWLLGFGSGDMQPPQLDDCSWRWNCLRAKVVLPSTGRELEGPRLRDTTPREDTSKMNDVSPL